MSRIPAYTTPSQFAQELHKIGLLYDIDEDPAEQSNVITGMPSFTPDECVILNDIRRNMSSDDVLAYTNEALVIIQESFQKSQGLIALSSTKRHPSHIPPEQTLEFKLQVTPNDVVVITPDGGIATITFEENTYTTYYQTRLVRLASTNEPIVLTEDDWEILGEGKSYHKDWDESSLTMDMIKDAVTWLCFGVANSFPKTK